LFQTDTGGGVVLDDEDALGDALCGGDGFRGQCHFYIVSAYAGLIKLNE
jgi:hypothetical protein